MLYLKSMELNDIKADALIIPVCEDKEIHTEKTIVGLEKKAKKLKEFSGKKEDDIVLYGLPGLKAERVIFLGLGKLQDLKPDGLRSLAGKAVKKCISLGLSGITITVPDLKKIKRHPAEVLNELLEGAALGNHIFDKYKKDSSKKPLKKITLLTSHEDEKLFAHLPTEVATVCEGTILARNWVSMPPNDKRPEDFAGSIVKLAKQEKLKVRVFDRDELQKNGFGGLLAVASGSDHPPRLVLLEHTPKGAEKTVAFVGKGVTFDSGGINLKPSGSIGDMKIDMAGAAAVAATMVTIARLKPKINVIGAIPIVENMPSGSATRPGDIFVSYAGKTVEVGNTDAEGRLILIDALAYVIKTYAPEKIIDIATLTGACEVALGKKIAGTFSNDAALSDAVVQSGNRTHERCWPMPLPDDYRELNKSKLADIKNLPSIRAGGAITAALFLAEFVGDTPWAHIDIAGPAYTDKENTYCNAGGTGFGVRLFWDLINTYLVSVRK